MDGRCPFCWDENVSLVGRAAASPRSMIWGRLMECGDCEKWYWADTGKEVDRLFEICATSVIQPDRCLEEVREILNSGGNGFSRRRTGEFNAICSDCLNACFIPLKAKISSKNPEPRLNQEGSIS